MNNKDHLQLARDLIIKRDLEWTQAHRDLDLKLIEDILSEGYQQIQDDGSSIGKSELLASNGSGNRQWDLAESWPAGIQ